MVEWISRIVAGTLFIWLGFINGQMGQAQHAYEASWRAGLLGMNQNPAAIAVAPHRGEFLLGAVDISAQNNLFETNEWGAFLPHTLLNNLVASPGSLAFITQVYPPDFYQNESSSWQASSLTTIQGPSVFWNLKPNPDWVERGLLRRIFALRLQRSELVQFDDIDPMLASGYARQFSNLAGTRITDEYFAMKVREWDALAGNFALTLGRGRNLFHLALGAKLHSAGAYMDFKSYGTSLEFQANESLTIASDSIVFAYNPSLAEAVEPFGERRFSNFENSWGLSGEFGIIYQSLNVDRKPRLELGASIQNLGSMRYWNLNQTTYQIDTQIAAFSLFRPTPGRTGVERANFALGSLASTSETGSDGIRESFPLLLTTHAKMRLGKKGWGLQLRADFRKETLVPGWQTYLRATLGYERENISFFIPVSTTLVLPSSANIVWRPRLGFFLTINDLLVLGSNDVLTTMFYSSTRDGVAASHLFLALHFPINRIY